MTLALQPFDQTERAGAAIRAKLAENPQILVVCTGNICRSPMGELLLSRYLSGTSITLSADMLKSATVVVVVLPFLFIYPFIQKYFTKGVTLGAVKG